MQKSEKTVLHSARPELYFARRKETEMNALKVSQIENFIAQAKSAGFVVESDETSNGSRFVSLTAKLPHYLDGSYHIMLVHRLPEKSKWIKLRQSVRLTSYFYAAQPGSKHEGTDGVRAAFNAISDVRGTWERHNAREAAKASATVTETVNA